VRGEIAEFKLRVSHADSADNRQTVWVVVQFAARAYFFGGFGASAEELSLSVKSTTF
jgi:hypothetical protein